MTASVHVEERDGKDALAGPTISPSSCVCVCVCVCVPPPPRWPSPRRNNLQFAYCTYSVRAPLSPLASALRQAGYRLRPSSGPRAASPAVHPAGAAVAAPPPHLPQQRTARVTRTHQHRARHIRAMHQTFLAAPSPRTKWSTSSPHGRHSTLPHSLRSWRITGHPPSSPQWTP